MAAGDASRKAVTFLKRPNCAQMFFIYPGRADVFRDQGMTFLSFMQSAGLGDRNLAMIADPYNENYARGISAEIPDLDALLGWHRQCLRELSQVTEIYHIGNSSGGYGAMLFGHLLGANKVWAVAPRAATLESADTAKTLLKDLLLSGGGGATEHLVFYSPVNRQDRAFAEYFSSCPGVVMSPYEVPPLETVEGLQAPSFAAHDWNHWGVMRTLRTSGDLRRLMPPFVGAAGCQGQAAP